MSRPYITWDEATSMKSFHWPQEHLFFPGHRSDVEFLGFIETLCTKRSAKSTEMIHLTGNQLRRLSWLTYGEATKLKNRTWARATVLEKWLPKARQRLADQVAMALDAADVVNDKWTRTEARILANMATSTTLPNKIKYHTGRDRP